MLWYKQLNRREFTGSTDMLYVHVRNIRTKNTTCIINESCSVKNLFFIKSNLQTRLRVTVTNLVYTSKMVHLQWLYICMHLFNSPYDVTYEDFGRVHTDVNSIVRKHLNRQILSFVSEVSQEKFPSSSFIPIIHVLPVSSLHGFDACAAVTGHIDFRYDFNMASVCISQDFFVVFDRVEPTAKFTAIGPWA